MAFPNVYGIDMPTGEELIGYNRSVEQICAEIGADRLIYQDLDDLVEAARRGNPKIEHFDLSCFNGEYVTGDINASYLNRIGALRSDEAKAKRAESENSLNDLHASEELSVDG